MSLRVTSRWHRMQTEAAVGKQARSAARGNRHREQELARGQRMKANSRKQIFVNPCLPANSLNSSISLVGCEADSATSGQL